MGERTMPRRDSGGIEVITRSTVERIAYVLGGESAAAKALLRADEIENAGGSAIFLRAPGFLLVQEGEPSPAAGT
jgi:hypothetical protein